MSEWIIVVLWAMTGLAGLAIAWQGVQEKLEQRDIHRQWIEKHGRGNG